MFIYESKSGNQKVAVGTVKEVKEISPDKTIVKLKDWKDNELSIWFNNKPGEAPGRQMADRVKKAKVKEGSFLACLILKTEEQKDATGIGFQYSGVFNLKEYKEDGTEAEVNVFIGLGCRPRKIKDGIYGISMPVRNRFGETDWYGISFFDGEKVKLAKNAEKLFQGNRRYWYIS